MIVIPSFHTADDVMVRVDGFTPGRVHRALDVARRVGGKPANVARFIARMGGSATLIAVADAALGQRLTSEATDAALGGRLTVELVTSPAASRTDIAIVDSEGALTVVNGQATTPGAAIVERLVGLITAGLGERDVLVLAGSLPAGVDPDIVTRLVRLGQVAGAMTIVDCSGPSLVAALEAGPDVVKVTVEELAEVRGDDAARAWRTGRQLAPEPAALIVSRGGHGARAWLGTGTYRIQAPLQVPVNPLGAGDAMTAGLAATLAAGGSMLEAIVAGCGWAAAEVGDFDLNLDPERARALASRVVVTRSRS